MDRRAFIGGLVLGTLGAPVVTHPQPARKIYRIGMLSAFTPTSEMVGPQSPFVNAPDARRPAPTSPEDLLTPA